VAFFDLFRSVDRSGIDNFMVMEPFVLRYSTIRFCYLTDFLIMLYCTYNNFIFYQKGQRERKWELNTFTTRFVPLQSGRMEQKMSDISVRFAGLEFKNPVFASSGPISDSPDTVEKCCKGGAGAVICKTVTPIPQLRVYPRPHDLSLEKFGLDRTGLGCGKLFADEAPEIWAKEVLPRCVEVCAKYDVVFIQSILGDGKNIDSWISLAQMMEENGAPALELNFSCPHSSAVAQMTGAQLGMDPVAAHDVAAAVRKHVKIPIFTKMTSRCEDVDQVAAACAAAGADGISVFNNPVGLWVDLENLSYFGQPASAWGYGGAFMQPMALYKTAKVHQNPNVTVPVYGGTGIWNADDALRFILLGNHAVQLQIAVMELGYDLFKQITDGIEQYMDRKGIADLAEIRGSILPKLVSNRDLPPDKKGDVVISIDEERCIGCERCKCCMWGVIEIQNGLAKAVNIDRCHGCGWCMSLCEQNAMRVIEKSGEVRMQF
jgi:dihydroorotate dehydrogenase subfamily 1